MTRCYLALGSNLQTPERQLRRAIDAIRKLPDISVIRVARFYYGKAWGRKVQPNFCNTVLAIDTSLTPERLLRECQTIEQKHGRLRLVKNGARTLDIDIILYGSKIIDKSTLTIPHPHMLNRDFVLLPLLEIAPDIRMPNGRRIGSLSS